MLFEHYVRYYIFRSVRLIEGLLGNSCSLGLRCVFLMWVPECHFVFFHPLVYGVGISF